jgi:hypothetical protein
LSVQITDTPSLLSGDALMFDGAAGVAGVAEVVVAHDVLE